MRLKVAFCSVPVPMLADVGLTRRLMRDDAGLTRRANHAACDLGCVSSPSCKNSSIPF
jgi:hypothetical protein